jgi:hypothetical protein
MIANGSHPGTAGFSKSAVNFESLISALATDPERRAGKVSTCGRRQLVMGGFQIVCFMHRNGPMQTFGRKNLKAAPANFADVRATSGLAWNLPFVQLAGVTLIDRRLVTLKS